MGQPTAYIATHSRLHKGNFAPKGKRFIVVSFKQNRTKYEASKLVDAAIINPTTIPIIAESMYKWLCNKYGI